MGTYVQHVSFTNSENRVTSHRRRRITNNLMLSDQLRHAYFPLQLLCLLTFWLLLRQALTEKKDRRTDALLSTITVHTEGETSDKHLTQSTFTCAGKIQRSDLNEEQAWAGNALKRDSRRSLTLTQSTLEGVFGRHLVVNCLYVYILSTFMWWLWWCTSWWFWSW